MAVVRGLARTRTLVDSLPLISTRFAFALKAVGFEDMSIGWVEMILNTPHDLRHPCFAFFPIVVVIRRRQFAGHHEASIL